MYSKKRVTAITLPCGTPSLNFTGLLKWPSILTLVGLWYRKFFNHECMLLLTPVYKIFNMRPSFHTVPKAWGRSKMYFFYSSFLFEKGTVVTVGVGAVFLIGLYSLCHTISDCPWHTFILMIHSFSWFTHSPDTLILNTGWQVWSTDLCEDLSRWAEERGHHHQHKNSEKDENTETCANECRWNGGKSCIYTGCTCNISICQINSLWNFVELVMCWFLFFLYL